MLLKTLGGDDLDQAERYHSDARAIFERAYGANSEKVALTLNYLAEVYRKQARLTLVFLLCHSSHDY